MDGQTDMNKRTVTFRNFANAPKERNFCCEATVVEISDVEFCDSCISV